MKKDRIIKLCMTICLILGISVMPINQLEVKANEIIATVQGTISSGTTSDLLRLSTPQGNMEIKLDSDTDASACKILLPGKKISVSVSRGSDSYLHAVKITSETQTSSTTLDASTTVTVKGTLSDKTKDDILYLNTSAGEMQIKLDSNTGMSGCSYLVAGNTYFISCARGSDAYMHAISISDTAGGAKGNSATGVTGTVGDSTKDNLLYLSTKEGEMQFVIDNETDTSKGMILTPGNTVTVSFYRGSDAYLHASAIVASKNNPSAVQLDTSSIVTVKGTVERESNENLLYLSTAQGKMELKLDVLFTLSNCKALVSGKKVAVTCVRGSDAYMHAINIAAE